MPELGVLVLVPAGTETGLDATAAHLVDGLDDLGQVAGNAEGDRRHEHAEPDRGRLARETGERGPGVGGRIALTAREAGVVVRPEEGLDPGVPRRLGRRPGSRRRRAPAGARSSGRIASAQPSRAALVPRGSADGRRASVADAPRALLPARRRVVQAVGRGHQLLLVPVVGGFGLGAHDGLRGEAPVLVEPVGEGHGRDAGAAVRRRASGNLLIGATDWRVRMRFPLGSCGMSPRPRCSGPGRSPGRHVPPSRR